MSIFDAAAIYVYKQRLTDAWRNQGFDLVTAFSAVLEEIYASDLRIFQPSGPDVPLTRKLTITDSQKWSMKPFRVIRVAMSEDELTREPHSWKHLGGLMHELKARGFEAEWASCASPDRAAAVTYTIWRIVTPPTATARIRPTVREAMVTALGASSEYDLFDPTEGIESSDETATPARGLLGTNKADEERIKIALSTANRERMLIDAASSQNVCVTACTWGPWGYDDTSFGGYIQLFSPLDVATLVRAGNIKISGPKGSVYGVSFAAASHIMPSSCNTIALHVANLGYRADQDDYGTIRKSLKDVCDLYAHQYHVTDATVGNFRTDRDGSIVLCDASDIHLANVLCQYPNVGGTFFVPLYILNEDHGNFGSRALQAYQDAKVAEYEERSEQRAYLAVKQLNFKSWPMIPVLDKLLATIPARKRARESTGSSGDTVVTSGMEWRRVSRGAQAAQDDPRRVRQRFEFPAPASQSSTSPSYRHFDPMLAPVDRLPTVNLASTASALGLRVGNGAQCAGQVKPAAGTARWRTALADVQRNTPAARPRDPRLQLKQ